MGNKAPTPVTEVDPAKKTSNILGPMSEQSTVRMDLQNEKCYWNGQEFSHGDQVLLGDKCYECSYSRWVLVDD